MRTRTAPAPAHALTSRLRLADALYPTLAAVVVAAGTLTVAQHTLWVWSCVSALAVALLCYLHVARLHAYLRGHAAEVRHPLMVLWWWHLAALVFTGCATVAAGLWALSNGLVEAILAALAALIALLAGRACWRALADIHRVLMDLQRQ